MRAGELRHQIQIQAPSKTRNAYGEEISSWVTVATVWSKISPLQGREYYEAQKINAEATHEIKIRYRAGLRPDMRFLYGRRIFPIESIKNTDERNIELICLCTEVVQ